MPELEFIPLSINQQTLASSNARLNQPSITSNSNSVTSINRGGNIASDQRGAEGLSIGSIASGSSGLANVDEAMNETRISKPLSRPTSPDGNSTNAAGGLKSNFRNWFSSNNTNKQQQQNVGMPTSVTSGSGNFGTDSNCITSSLSANIITNNTTCTTTTTGTNTTTINKNPLKSELQSQQEKHTQGSFFDK